MPRDSNPKFPPNRCRKLKTKRKLKKNLMIGHRCSKSHTSILLICHLFIVPGNIAYIPYDISCNDGPQTSFPNLASGSSRDHGVYFLRTTSQHCCEMKDQKGNTFSVFANGETEVTNASPTSLDSTTVHGELGEFVYWFICLPCVAQWTYCYRMYEETIECHRNQSKPSYSNNLGALSEWDEARCSVSYKLVF